MYKIRCLVPLFVTTIFLICCHAGPHEVLAAAPEISDPDGLLDEGAAPGTFPSTVTATHVNIQPIPGSELNGANSNNLKVTFPASGPIKWTESRHNEGDVALLIGPAMPNDPSYYPPNDFVDNYQPLSGGNPHANTVLGWRVSFATGGLFASVHHNGVNNQDVVAGQPVGITHGVAYMNLGSAQGYGFRMEDGVFANGLASSSDLQMGIAGNDDGAGEASFDVSVAYFPYEEGWMGGWVSSPVDGVGSLISGSADFQLSWNGDIARVGLPPSIVPDDIMMFVAPGSSDNNSNIAAAAQDPIDSSIFNVAVREDNDADRSGQTFATDQLQYQFLVLPYNTPQLVGGHVQGNGSVKRSAAGDRFTLTRRSQGEYLISIRDLDGVTPISDNDGMLMLSVTGNITAGIPDRAFLSYDYDENAKGFVVQARELTGVDDPASANFFGDRLSLEDTDFYFAYIDFENPPKRTLAGDFDGDGSLGAGDIDLLSSEVRRGGMEQRFDLNGDRIVNQADRIVWIDTLRKTYVGDANLDGEFNSTDFVAVFIRGEYEDALENNSGWADGDWNGDAEFSSSDFVEAFRIGAYEQGPRAAASVPEPASFFSVIMSVLAFGVARRRGCDPLTRRVERR